MDGLVSRRNKRSYDDFKKQIPPKIQPVFDLLRKFCFSLGDDVTEDVRMHRVVFCKSLTFRWFVDIEPEQDSIFLKIQTSRKEPQRKIRIKNDEEFDSIKEILKNAYKSIH